jgi:hypothetical protein
MLALGVHIRSNAHLMILMPISSCPYSLEFQSRTTIMSQPLVDFIVEWTDMNTRVSDSSLKH